MKIRVIVQYNTLRVYQLLKEGVHTVDDPIETKLVDSSPASHNVRRRWLRSGARYFKKSQRESDMPD
jgi:hypothetical protein